MQPTHTAAGNIARRSRSAAGNGPVHAGAGRRLVMGVGQARRRLPGQPAAVSWFAVRSATLLLQCCNNLPECCSTRAFRGQIHPRSTPRPPPEWVSRVGVEVCQKSVASPAESDVYGDSALAAGRNRKLERFPRGADVARCCNALPDGGRPGPAAVHHSRGQQEPRASVAGGTSGSDYSQQASGLLQAAPTDQGGSLADLSRLLTRAVLVVRQKLRTRYDAGGLCHATRRS